jgi:hypothetical protein
MSTADYITTSRLSLPWERLSWGSVSGLILGIIVLYMLGLGTYRLFFSPLSKIPGPWHHALSDFGMSLHQARFRTLYRVDELFHKYGPVVRGGPNKVYFLDGAAMRDVYFNFDKDTWYMAFKTHNTGQVLTIT